MDNTNITNITNKTNINDNINDNIETLTKNAKLASYKLASSTLEDRNNILLKLKELLITKRSDIEKANQLDIQNAKEEITKGSYSSTLIKRQLQILTNLTLHITYNI